ncbi:bifunctional proline dehydrogenase/L-glutamate gamma-semialdehyde dehydrogenase PutA [Pontivivens nitratireducens]|uniref:Bifunctional protein PutA n=1 Tax=Pontivivens nitratireducens TaxID=2758038 RepID=A0A6G7VNJ9_9RHOB|nr:bifunctional proline dehydrogenase/L-glutamate gamma-semialdehyde dehydrogenase PutA [Pontibrevibacter nitratireducens]QIK41619.1 bifunctional proline dehydrogenase/L-glutamate gamma-semialdehyde dehydrogenase PutA [Pontibrevibacter nitratireducens]
MNVESTPRLDALRATIRTLHVAPDDAALDALMREQPLGDDMRVRTVRRATALVEAIRTDAKPGVMEVFLAEYGLSTDEGVALMCLAEALLRVPDPETIDALIEDKIAPSSWGEHLGKSSSSLVNASTWALMLTGKVLKEDRRKGVAATLHGAVKRLGEPVIRTAVGRAMKELGHQFVLGRTIEEAVKRGKQRQSEGYTYSYDMLGEAALTARDADNFMQAYRDAITKLAPYCTADDIRDNPGISIKLSALHPRYEVAQRQRVMTELVARTTDLARQARAAGMGLNIDAEEADRLDISLDVIQAVLSDPELAGWDGFGVVVQAYGKRAAPVIDWLYALAENLDRKIMVRLVKGAYWDTEVKRAQVEGRPGFPVYTRKPATDVSYICVAQKLLGLTDRIYPQFATHNAHTVAAVLEMAQPDQTFEFQRLHGMGAALYDIVLRQPGARCRIYAPVGAHRDLLAYLVRRLLENGANSSFVNQIVDADVPPAVVAADPFAAWQAARTQPSVTDPADIFPGRANSRGFDLRDLTTLDEIEAARTPFASHRWQAAPILAVATAPVEAVERVNPARPDDIVGTVRDASFADAQTAIAHATTWNAPVAERSAVLLRAADLMEGAFGEIFALLTREAGKTLIDGVAELREAVDFLRYYAGQAVEGMAPAGIFACISPWNFPLAIFCGQISAALAVGNGVLAKPAEQSPLIGALAVRLLHQAGVPRAVLQFLPGAGSVVGAALSSDARIGGVCFTGSTATAMRINRAMADGMAPDAPLIAETGGLNAMIVDSTALPEQAVRDIVMSSFQSAGQRCSALRVLYVQQDVAPAFLRMLEGTMDEQVTGDPWNLSTDIGPVIDDAARRKIEAHVARAEAEGRLRKRLSKPASGTFTSAALIEVSGIEALEEEIFGPVLHVATFHARDLDRVVDVINARGYGLTFGMHSRIDDRVEQVCARLEVGNIYINRNQIGAIVGSQPFGGEGLSGTGPKAGGPHYLPRFTATAKAHEPQGAGRVASLDDVQRALDQAVGPKVELKQIDLPGPTGESNRLSTLGRGVVLCLGPSIETARAQVAEAAKSGCRAVIVAPGATAGEGIDGVLPAKALTQLRNVAVVASDVTTEPRRALRKALAQRAGPIVPLVGSAQVAERSVMERHVCIDTTAAGGNAALLAESA